MIPRPAILAVMLLTACGARSSLPEPPGQGGAPPAAPIYCNGDQDTLVYVVTEESTLLRFDPPAGSFDTIGPLDCPAQAGATPFSMAVDHTGQAYVEFDDGELFTVSVATASPCKPTSFTPDPSFTTTFGTGFSADPGGATESLFVATDGAPERLGRLDTADFSLHPVGQFSKDIGDAELTGTGDGKLFAFGVVSGLKGGHFAEIDKTDATVLSDTIVGTPQDPTAWAFAFWGGDFYFFTSAGSNDTSVARLHEDGSFDASYASLPSQRVVGAGVSTCAPQ